MEYADPELLISKWLHDQLDIKTWADPNIPDNWRYTAPIAHVQRGDGFGVSVPSLDDVTLDVDVYAANADHARKTGGDIWAAMELKLPLTVFDNGIFVKHVETTTKPRWVSDPKIYRRTSAFRIILHGLI